MLDDTIRMETFTEDKGKHYVFNGTKTWSSNGSIAAQTIKGSGVLEIALLLVNVDIEKDCIIPSSSVVHGVGPLRPAS